MSERIHNTDVDKRIGERLRKWRKMIGMSRKELAGILHISDDALYRIESGATGLSPNYAYILANELNCDMNYIFSKEEIPYRTIEMQTGLPAGRRAAIMLRYCLEILENEHGHE